MTKPATPPTGRRPRPEGTVEPTKATAPPTPRWRLRTKLLVPTVLSGLVLAFALVSAVRAGAQVRKQVFARVAETADLLSAIVASAELAGEATDYEQLQNVLDSIQREDENKVAR